MFVIGFAMVSGGVYLLLQSIQVTSNFGFGYGLYHMGSLQVTSGMVLIPFLLGVGMVFWNAKNIFGWLLSGGSLVALVFGVLASVQFHLQRMSLFELLTILILTVGGGALFFRSLQTTPKEKPAD
jgi:hypothetical protein